MKQIAAAFQFLTILPLPVKTGSKYLERSIAWFPLVGMVVGVISVCCFYLFTHILPPPIAMVLMILVYILLTRGLHLDGYMDTIDGFFSHRKREDVLRIMKDPQVGSFAVLGTGVWFSILFAGLPIIEPLEFIMIQTYMRFALLIPALVFPYARESGTGKFFVENVKMKTVMGALIVTAVVMTGLYFAAGHKPARLAVYGASLLLAVMVSLFIGWWSKRKIGGITGDVMGFAAECSHLVQVILVAGVFGYKMIPNIL